MTILNKLIKKIKRNAGFSMTELAFTTGIMATMVTVAAPKFAGVARSAQARKTMDNLGKLQTIANQFYSVKGQRVSASNPAGESQGRLPGQESYDEAIGGYEKLTDFVAAIPNFKKWTDAEGSKWRSVYGMKYADTTAYTYQFSNDEDNSKYGPTEWFSGTEGDQKPIKSPYRQGHYIYTVIKGGQSEAWNEGTNSWVYDDSCHDCGPILVVADAYNPSRYHLVKSFN